MQDIIKIIQKAVDDLFGKDILVQLTRPEARFGDLATNVAMQIAKKTAENPRQVAERITSKLQKMKQFKAVSIAGPGFINLTIDDKLLLDELKKVVNLADNYGKPDKYKGQTVITEYSDPNPFKVLHVGHLYTSVVGDAISNLIESSGGEVHRVNFGGDVGLHVAKTLWAIIKRLGGELPDELMKIDKASRPEFMAACYVEGTRAYEDDEIAKTEITALNKKVYDFHIKKDQDSPLAKIYWLGRQWSYDYFDSFYQRIGVAFEKYYPESLVAPVGLSTVLEQKDKGIYKDSDGAVVFVGEDYGLHTRVFVNQEGLPTYEAKDVGLSITKAQDYDFNESIIITGNDIIEYMKVVLKSIEQFRPDLSSKTRHITHGNVKLTGGVKMASRKGNFLRAVDVLDMVAEANQIAQGNQDNAPVLGAIKYAFLKNRIGADIIFEPSESVSLQGNSGPYLQYSLARGKSIINRAGVEDYRLSLDSVEDLTEVEKSVVLKMSEYPEVLKQAVAELAPHQICTYLYELAQSFNRFYENSPVIGDERQDLRLCLVEGYTMILQAGLKILGVPTPERM